MAGAPDGFTSPDLECLVPASRYALTVNECTPFESDVVSNLPAGSPPNWYGAELSVHVVVPSIMKSILSAVVPPEDAVQVTWPERVMWSSSFEPSIDDETVNPFSVLDAELDPVIEMASAATATKNSAKTARGFTRLPPE